jgi:hypothetical protein
LTNDYCIEPKPTIVTAGDEDFEKTAASVELSVVEDCAKKDAVTRMSATFPESFSATSICPASDTLVEVLSPLRSITAVHEKPMVTRFSTSAPSDFAVPLARTKPTAAMEHASFPQLQSYLRSSMPLLGY